MTHVQHHLPRAALVAVGILAALLCAGLAAPAEVSALNYACIAYEDIGSQTFTGSSAFNQVPTSVQWGTPSSSADSVVNSVYVVFSDEASCVECGYSWDRLTNGTTVGPYVFSVRINYGNYDYSGALSGCVKGTTYKWFVRRKTGQSNYWEAGFDSTVLKTWSTSFTYGRFVQTAVEHQLAGTVWSSEFHDMWWRKYGDTAWYKWLNWNPSDQDPYYDMRGDRFAWETYKP